jgi:hypothetical protein
MPKPMWSSAACHSISDPRKLAGAGKRSGGFRVRHSVVDNHSVPVFNSSQPPSHSAAVQVMD